MGPSAQSAAQAHLRKIEQEDTQDKEQLRQLENRHHSLQVCQQEEHITALARLQGRLGARKEELTDRLHEDGMVNVDASIQKPLGFSFAKNDEQVVMHPVRRQGETASCRNNAHG